MKDKSIEGLVKDAAKILKGGMDPVVGDRQEECFLNSPWHSIAQAFVTVITECRWDRRKAEISYRARVVLKLLGQAQSSAWTAKQESNFPVTLTSFKSRAVESVFHSLNLNNPPHIITVHSLYQQVLLSAPVSTDPALGSSQTTVKLCRGHGVVAASF